MKHSAEINGNKVLEICLVGKINNEEFSKLEKEVEKIINSLKRNNEPIMISGDFTHAGKLSYYYNNFLNNLFNNTYHRIALFGLDRIPEDSLWQKIKENNLQGKVSLFHTGDEAEKWLSEYSSD